MRRLLILALPALVAGCSATPSTPVAIPGESPTPPPPASPWISSMAPGGNIGVVEKIAEGTFQATGTTAITYDPRIVPDGATAQVAVGQVPRGMAVRLSVTGMLARRSYGAHLHTAPCTAEPAAAGPHYQHQPQPLPSESPSMPPSGAAKSSPAKSSAAKISPGAKAPSMSPPPPSGPAPDPAFANPRNEVWLDFTADRLGKATSTAVLTWAFNETKPPRSLIVHAARTRTDAGFAGTAGARVACLTLPG